MSCARWSAALDAVGGIDNLFSQRRQHACIIKTEARVALRRSQNAAGQPQINDCVELSWVLVSLDGIEPSTP
jgi:hypothetical protein